MVRLQCLNVQQPEKRRQRSIFNLDLNLIFITQAKEAHHEKWYVKVDNTAILRNAKAKYTRNDRDLKKQNKKQTNNNEDVTTRNMVTWRFSLLASKSIILDIAFDTDPRIQVIGGCPLVSFIKKNLLSRHWKYARQIFWSTKLKISCEAKQNKGKHGGLLVPVEVPTGGLIRDAGG